MKNKILNLISTKPKHYVKLIKKDLILKKWVDENSLIQSDKFVEMIYSAVYQKTNICPNGNKKRFSRVSTGFVGCGPANICQCTKDSISKNVSITKLKYTESKNNDINQKRNNSMFKKYGVNFNSQRLDIKHLWTKPKISEESYDKLTDFNWLNEEYNNKNRTLVDIADELGIYYSTVAEYCKKFGFKIRQITNYSLQEKEIEDFIIELDIVCIRNDWAILETQEIDILISDHKLGIELDGLYWHSYHPKNKKYEDKNRHINKTNKAKNKDIDIIHITDFEWANKQSIIKNIIKSKLNLNKKIYARKCSIQQVNKDIEKEFLKTYHLQGYVPSIKNYGLFINNELMMIITIGKSRFNNRADYEVLRVCSKDGITIVGGLSKLIKHIKQQYNQSSFVTYCDLNKSTGNSYKKIGLIFLENTGPGYFWTDGNGIISRYKCQKKQLAKWLKTFDPKLSESENMFNAGYRRFWDCGNAVYTF